LGVLLKKSFSDLQINMFSLRPENRIEGKREAGSLLRRPIFSKGLSVADSQICNLVTGPYTET